MEGGSMTIVQAILSLIFLIAFIAGTQKLFVKAGKPGWAAIVPIYNIIVLLEVVGKPLWWIVLLLIPIVNIVIFILISIQLAKAFGKDTGYGIGLFLIPFVFYPLLGFGSAQYVGPPQE